MLAHPWCVYCGLQPVDPRWRPFCSERCKLADLGRWLTGNYRIPGTPVDGPPSLPGPGDDEEH